jgi:NAD(P)-dependent dehydrogenase (short-subunit alcohol dehydrogenase family)
MSAEAPNIGYGLTGKIALVTGGSRNIGRSIALTLAAAGATPIVLFREDERAARAVCDAISNTGGRAGMYRAELTDVPGLRRVVQEIERDFGAVDILVNNAAIRPRTKISAITVEEWDRVFASNLRAPFFLSQAVLPGMIRNKWGRIVNVGGVDAYWGKPLRAHNVSAKLGLVGLTRALANEVARFGVTVNAVIPGNVDTVRPHPEWYPDLGKIQAERRERIPMARIGAVQEVANACLFLASDLSAYTTAQEFFVSGGAYPLVRHPLDDYGAGEF